MKYLFPEILKSRGILGEFVYSNFLLLIAGYAVIAAAAYFLGSINTAIIISKKKYGYDIREYGSGNAGMTNMFRTFGKKAGLLTLAGDAAKSAVALILAFVLLGDIAQYIAGFFVIAGHVFPAYFRFKGGKGVIAAAITILFIDPPVFLVLMVLFGLMFAATRIISVSSITAAFFYPMVVYGFNRSSPDIFIILFSILISIFVIAMHWENIIRLKNGEEKKFSMGKKNDK